MTSIIVAVLVDRIGAERALKAAYEASLAIRDARVAAFHVSIDPDTTILPTEEMMTDERRREVEREQAETERAVRNTYERIAEQLGPGRFEWCRVVGREKDEVARLTSVARLVVMPLPGEHASGYVREAFHAALYDTHCPLLVVPPTYVRRPLERIAIGWNDDDACVRSVRAAEPWLRQARNVSVIHVGQTSRVTHPEKVRELLAELGVRATFRMIEPNGSPQGEQVLKAAEDADWLVMGGYHHKQVVEWLVGGVSRTIFHITKLPVFTMH